MQVNEDQIKDAWNEIDNNLKRSLEVAHKRIQKFHEKEIPHSFTIKGEYGDIVQRRWRPVKNAGIYIPGGRAAYPSTVLMNAIPATVAGVKQIIMVAPGNKEGKINKTVLAAAHLSGINKVFTVDLYDLFIKRFLSAICILFFADLLLATGCIQI